jgi:hypothetical protein
LFVGCLIPPFANLECYGLYVNTENTLALALALGFFSQQLVVRALARAPLISAGLQMLYCAEVDDQEASSISCTGLGSS